MHTDTRIWVLTALFPLADARVSGGTFIDVSLHSFTPALPVYALCDGSFIAYVRGANLFLCPIHE